MIKQAKIEKSQKKRVHNDMSDPEIDLESARIRNKHAEANDPDFRLAMEKLRRAARAIGRNVDGC